MCFYAQYKYSCGHDACQPCRAWWICDNPNGTHHRRTVFKKRLPTDCSPCPYTSGRQCPYRRAHAVTSTKFNDKDLLPNLRWYVPEFPVLVTIDIEAPCWPLRYISKRKRRTSSIESVSPKSSPRKKKKVDDSVRLDPLAQPFQPVPWTLQIVGGKKRTDTNPFAQTSTSSPSGTESKANHVMNPLARSFTSRK